MRSKITTGAAILITAAAIAGCSSTTSSHPQAADQPTSAAQAKPVSALLAVKTAPVTTMKMPKADASWIAAVQKTMDDGKPIAQGATGVSVNLMALDDEAAKTSDLDALVKLCYFCSDPAKKGSSLVFVGRVLTRPWVRTVLVGAGRSQPGRGGSSR